MTVLINGTGVSRGISIGHVHILRHGMVEVEERRVSKKEVKVEIARFKEAQKKAVRHLRKIRKSIPKNAPADIASFIDSHLLMLDDSLLGQAPIDIIKNEQCNAEYALKLQQEQLVTVFDQMHNDYLRTRRNDVEHVIGLIQSFLIDHNYGEDAHDIDRKDQIIVADDLTPADTIVLQHQHIAGFITELGGTTSHTAILARSLNIAAVVAVHNVRSLLRNGEKIILDGSTGTVVAGADEKILKEYVKKQRAEKKQQKGLRLLSDKPTLTQDKNRIKLMANIDLAEDIRSLKKSGAEGIGLYRTEFLYLGQDQMTGENEQLQIYRKVLRAMEGKPVTIRTLDLGAEKEFDPEYDHPLVPNPALGRRAIRRSLKDPAIFMMQLRAILRASAYGPVRIMFPMLTNMHELDQALQLLQTAKEQLRKSRKRYSEDLQVGGMIEVPAAALLSPVLARHLDFLSIGTNDLIQYTLAIDRIDDQVSYLYDPLHPGFLKLIAMVIEAGEQADVPVAMCGEMAGDTLYTRLLLGLGLKEYSVHPSALLEVKKIILDSNVVTLRKKCHKLLNEADYKKIPQLVSAL